MRGGVEFRLFFPGIQASYCYDPKLLLKSLYFRPFHAPLVSFTGLKLKSDHVMTNFMIVWWLNLCHRDSCFTVCLQLCRVSHFLARYNPRSVDRCKVHHHRINKICLERAAFEEFATAVLKTVAICAKIIFYESREWNQRYAKRPEKKPFQQKYGIDSISRHIPSPLDINQKSEGSGNLTPVGSFKIVIVLNLALVVQFKVP